jgi:polysaccharide biosynthesis protein PslG
MASSGVQSVRAQFSWVKAQPYPGWDFVPQGQASRFVDEGGIPTDWSRIDQIVAGAAARHLTVLPVLITSPAWAAIPPSTQASPPRDPAAYARFASAAVRRYGPGGAFWAQHPELQAQPIRDWQIWNEPNFRVFWRPKNWPRPYVALLRAARTSIKAVDPGARIVLGGLPQQSWTALEKIYRAGGRGLFDIAAIHPFTSKVTGAVEIVRRGEAVMRRFGDGAKPVWLTEITWPSSHGHTNTGFGYEVSQRAQAQKLADAFRTFAALRGQLRIERVYWYTWMSPDRSHTYPFDWSGLSALHGSKVVRKPALAAFRKTALALEGR